MERETPTPPHGKFHFVFLNTSLIQINPDIVSSVKRSIHIGTRVFAIIIINNNIMIIIINNNIIINIMNNNINIITILITTATATGRFSQVLRSASTSYRCQVCSQVTSLLNSTEGNSAVHQTIKHTKQSNSAILH